MAWYDLINRITAENEYAGQTFLQKHFNYRILVKYLVMAISLPEKNYKSILKYSNSGFDSSF